MNPYNLPEGLEPHFSRYIRFIESCPKRDIKKITGELLDIHHILPRSLGGSDENYNLIKLTYKEHFVAHHILWKCYNGVMVQAFWAMQHKHKIRLSAIQYEKLRKEESLLLKGRVLSEEHKRKISESHKGDKNPMYGKIGSFGGHYGKKHSLESRIKISKSRKGKLIGKDNPFYGKKHSIEVLEKIRETSSGKNSAVGRKVQCLETKEIFNTITEAEDKYKIKRGIGNCCTGRLKQTHGLHWEYYKENKD